MLFLTYCAWVVPYGWLMVLCILQTVQTVLALSHLFRDVCSVFVQFGKTDSSVFQAQGGSALSRLRDEGSKSSMFSNRTPLILQVLP